MNINRSAIFVCLGMIAFLLLNTCYFIFFTMATSFERLKSITLRTKDLINGYIRNCEMDLFGKRADQNPYYHIPQLVNNYCILFYEIFTWYKKNYGQGLEFVSDTEVKVIHKLDKWTTCFLENTISNEICDAFSMTFKVISFGEIDQDTPDFCVGYTNRDSIENAVADWDEALWRGVNQHKTHSWGFYGYGLYHSESINVFNSVSENVDHSRGDLWTISFDFKAKKVKIYRFEEEMDCRELRQTKSWIGFSFFYSESHIELVEYKYD